MPVFYARRDPDDVPWFDLLLFSTFLLDPASSGRHDQGLAEWMGMPSRAGARIERDVRTRGVRGVILLEERIDADGAGEMFGRRFTGGPGAVSCDGNRAQRCV